MGHSLQSGLPQGHSFQPAQCGAQLIGSTSFSSSSNQNRIVSNNEVRSWLDSDDVLKFLTRQEPRPMTWVNVKDLAENFFDADPMPLRNVDEDAQHVIILSET